VGSTNGEVAERYTIQTHGISVTHFTGVEQKVVTEDALFKLDSNLGSVWRLNANAFSRIPVRDLVSQKAFAESQKRLLLKRLDAITIPVIDFQQESFSNAVAFLQEQIKQLDPTIAAGSETFLRLRYTDSEDSTLVTFTARDITAQETLNILVDIAGMQYRLEYDHIIITPRFAGGGQVIVRIYEVSPSLRERLHGTTISNILSEIGFNLKPWTKLQYSPELDIIAAGTTYQGHRQFQELLYSTDLARQWPGRFRLVPLSQEGKPTLFLLDDKTGETWLYRATILPDGSRTDSFDVLQTHSYPEQR